MARDDSVVEKPSASRAMVGNQGRDGLHGYAIVIGGHIRAQGFGDVAVPALRVCLQCRFGIGKNAVNGSLFRIEGVLVLEETDEDMVESALRGFSFIVVLRQAYLRVGDERQREHLS